MRRNRLPVPDRGIRQRADTDHSEQRTLSTFDTFVASGIVVTFDDNGETNTGWTTGNALDGQWNRGIPVNCNRGDPSSDADGSGQCWLTDNSAAANCNSDVDDGATVLISPVLDGSVPGRIAGGTHAGTPTTSSRSRQRHLHGGDLRRRRHHLDRTGNRRSLGEGTTGGWIEASFILADIPGITPSSQMQLRFTAADAGSGSVIEAGVDAIVISAIECEAPCLGDVANNDGQVDVNDLLAIIAAWNTSNPQFDLDGNGQVDVNDLLIVIGAWGSCRAQSVDILYHTTCPSHHAGPCQLHTLHRSTMTIHGMRHVLTM